MLGPPMPTISDDAVCIRRWDFSETSQTVSLFTRAHGVIRGLAKGAKREKGAFSGGFDVLTRGNLVAIVKPGRDLATLTAWDLQDTMRHLRSNLAANRTAMFMADLVHHMVTDHDPHQRLYDALIEALTALRDPARIDAALLVFQWRLLQEAGYEPVLDRDVQTGRPLPRGGGGTLAFSPAAGGVVIDSGAGDRWRVRAETIKLLRDVATAGPGNDALAASDPGTIDRANRLLASYLRELIGDEPAAFRWRFEDLAGRK